MMTMTLMMTTMMILMDNSRSQGVHGVEYGELSCTMSTKCCKYLLVGFREKTKRPSINLESFGLKDFLRCEVMVTEAGSNCVI
ncbi:hypothetical protein BD289DRAFT_102880 [Coniella lustricola]|uniref:Secreted protein n=1 Tax=Coniella lustricola TaxID=2025994 RepID=A0A2T2ZY11_9PEZI|nr:hypothetical protein BD289DRAFT_102880 [Coniella lustricola]